MAEDGPRPQSGRLQRSSRDRDPRERIPVAHKDKGQVERVSGYSSNAVGWAKTHELLLAPLDPTTTEQDAARLAYLNRHPVLAIPDPKWIYRTRAINDGIRLF